MADQEVSRPLPTPIDRTQPFWDALRERKVKIQYSPSSDRWVFYPARTPR